MLTVQTFTFNSVQENTYVLYNEKGECGIIDPGCYFAPEEAQLTAFIADNGLKPVFLLNTHCHLDHIFGNKFVAQKWGLELWMHRLEIPVFERGPAFGQMWQLPFDNYAGPFHHFDEGDILRIGDDELHILFTPGHSPGSVVFHVPAQKFLIGGDVLFNGSIGRTDLPGGDFNTLQESIRTKLYTLPEDTIVYPGHGETTTIGDEAKGNPFVKMV